MRHFYLRAVCNVLIGLTIFYSTTVWGNETRSIGFKIPNDPQVLAYGINTQKSSYLLISQIDTLPLDTVFIKEVKNDFTWIITEPLGGIIGGVLLANAVGWTVALHVCPEDPGMGVYHPYTIGAALVGGAIGTGLGIWWVGKYIEKEKGSLWKAILGSGIGIGFSFIFLGDSISGCILTIGGGLIGYRLSLK